MRRAGVLVTEAAYGILEDMVPTLLITGATGVGKSTVTAEINDVLAEHRIPNAAIDLDALVWQWPSSSPWNDDPHVRQPEVSVAELSGLSQSSDAAMTYQCHCGPTAVSLDFRIAGGAVC